jgi:GMP synthase (glutamine-hydrolysing)
VKPILVIEQDELLPGVGLLGERLTELGVPFRRLQTWNEDLAGLHARDFAAVVPLGGAMHAWDDHAFPFLREEVRLLGEAVEEQIPVLGVCLGAQLLARALGARVGPGERHEIGWLGVTPTGDAAGDPLFAHARGTQTVYQWHLDGFELPGGAVHLASSERFPCQAFRFGSAWGVQFHPEVDLATFELWYGNHPGAAAAHGVDEDVLFEAVRRGDGDRDSFAFRAGLFDAFAAYVSA